MKLRRVKPDTSARWRDGTVHNGGSRRHRKPNLPGSRTMGISRALLSWESGYYSPTQPARVFNPPMVVQVRLASVPASDDTEFVPSESSPFTDSAIESKYHRASLHR